MKHYYYLHTNGALIHKNSSVVDSLGASDYFDSDFVVKWWVMDDESRMDAWNLCIFSLEAGAKKERIDELILKWGLTDDDAKEYCERVCLDLGIDGSKFSVRDKNNFTNMQECPCGFGETAFAAICDFYSQVGPSTKSQMVTK